MNALVLNLLACACASLLQDPAPELEPPGESEWRRIAAGEDPTPRQDAAGAATLTLYDVRDLALPAGPLPPPEGTGEGAREELEAQLEARREQAAGHYRDLAEIIRTYLSPPLARDGSHEVRATSDGTLIVVANADQHAWIAAFLDLQRRTLERHYTVEFRVVRTSQEGAERLALSESPRVLGPGEELADFLDRLTADPMPFTTARGW